MKIKISIFLLLAFLVNNSKSQTLDDTHSGYNGVWTYGGESPTLPSLYSANPYLKGGFVKLRWALLQPNDSAHFDWNYFVSTLQNTSSLGLLVGVQIFAGPDCPNWMYNYTPSVVTTSAVFASYPYYLNSTYQRLYFKMLDSVSRHIDLLPSSTRNLIVYYESAEGKTGDGGPYAGAVLPAFSTYTISDNTWSLFKHVVWNKLNTLYSPKVPKIHLVLNQMNGTTEDSFLDTNIPYAWRKTGDVGDGYQLNDEMDLYNDLQNNINAIPSTSCLTNGRATAEMDAWRAPYYQQNVKWNSYYQNIWALTFGMDMIKPTTPALQDPNFSSGFNFFSKYAGQKDPLCATGAFCVLRDGLNASDFSRFPVTTYYNGNIDNYGKRALKIANTYSLNGSVQADTSGSNGGSLNQKSSNAMNDVGWNIWSGNYERYLTQWSPNTTSQGFWCQGDTTQPYGRFARGFNHLANMDTMFFNINDSLFSTFPNNAATTVTINITYLDKGTSKWKLMYDGKNSTTSLSQLMTAYTTTNTNTTNTNPITNVNRNQNYVWKTKSVIIENGMFGNNLPHNTDLMLVNKDNTDEIFHMIEIVKPAIATAGLKSYEHKKIDDYLLYPNPTNGDLNISSNKIISGKWYEINITNLLGQVVYTDNLIANNNLLILNCSYLLNGIYLVELKSEEVSIVKKIIKE